MMDLSRWAQVVERLLAPGGRLFIFEGHPLDWVWDSGQSEFIFDSHDGHYFSDVIQNHRWPAPYIDSINTNGLKLRAHEHQWTLGQIINTLIDTGLALQRFEEYPEPFWDHFANIPKETLHRIPHSFSLLMTKTMQKPQQENTPGAEAPVI